MIKPKCCTTVDIKSKNFEGFKTLLWKLLSAQYYNFPKAAGHKLETRRVFDQFCKLIEDQFAYGGKKYAHSGQKESTDLIAERWGVDWVLGTCYKYCKRYQNLRRERDLLKVATYQFIIWLQMGYHQTPAEHALEGLDANVIRTWCLLSYEASPSFDIVPEFLDASMVLMERFTLCQDEGKLLNIAVYMFLAWIAHGYAESADHDTDTWNEKAVPAEEKP